MFWLCHAEATAGSFVQHPRERGRALAAGQRALHPRIAAITYLDKCRPQQSEERRPVPEKLSRQSQHQIQRHSPETICIPRACSRGNASPSIFEALVGCLSILGIYAPLRSAKTPSDADPSVDLRFG